MSPKIRNTGIIQNSLEENPFCFNYSVSCNHLENIAMRMETTAFCVKFLSPTSVESMNLFLQTAHNVASDQGLHCLPTGFSIEK